MKVVKERGIIFAKFNGGKYRGKHAKTCRALAGQQNVFPLKLSE
jgi:hypothetical protein